MIIKTTKCKCGKEYIDFENQLGNCPVCSEDQMYAEAQQKILKNLTYMTTDAAFKIVLRLLTNEAVRIKIEDGLKVQRLSCEESHALDPKPVITIKESLIDRFLAWCRR
jgi:hypothetical protein